ncbi:MAG: hydantoinase/oxoprolinase family protein [Deltaproteobacteria bacterium]|nr:hydantoinase/oxoprolinase family protein [Deltaproteobacteria bacterium]
MPRTRVREVPERVDQAGRVLLPLDENAVRSVVEEASASGAEAIAVCLLWSFRNPSHELRIREIIREVAGDRVAVSLSSEVSPVIGEYERTSSTLISAYLAPAARSHYRRVEKMLSDSGFRGNFSVLNSLGGVIPASDAAERAVLTVLSGPTGGVTGSRYLAQTLGHSNVITSDMGGTSFDVSVIVQGQPLIALGKETSGYHCSTPMVDIATIGAGGGSIVTVRGGLIKIGPESAGSIPGPVCYGRGGARPTVTDADVVLGIVDPENFLGGRMKLDARAAARAIQEQVADPLGIGLEEAAAGIRRIVDSQMADLLREVTVNRGHDPRNFVLYAYGGAGPTHAAGYGRELGIRQIIVPATSMVHSAYGALASDTLFSAERSRVLAGRADGLGIDAKAVEEEFQALETQCEAALEAAGFGETDRELRRFAEIRYRMQTHQLMVPVPLGRITADLVGVIAARFAKSYEETYGQESAFTLAGIEIVTFRVEGVGRTPKPAFATLAGKERAVRRQRMIYREETKRREPVAVLDWRGLAIGERVDGPTIIEHPSTTVVVGQAQCATMDQFGNLVIEEGGVA